MKNLEMNKNFINIKFKKLNKKAIIPTFSKQFDSGMDLRSIEAIEIKQGVITPVHTGLSVELPDSRETYPFTLEMQIRPRSGLAIKHGITVVNSPGTIDNKYRGELIVLLTILKDCKDNYFVHEGDRIAQSTIVPILSTNVLKVEEVEELSKTERETGGFGSTGIK